jgi:hypothetical protein
MRHFHTLDTVLHDPDNDTLLFQAQASEDGVSLWFGQEGLYVTVSARFGPLEIALRPRRRDLKASLHQLQPTKRQAVTRMVGTGQAHLELGLLQSGELLVRAAIVADATGHVAINTLLTPDTQRKLYEWLEVDAPATQPNRR